MPVQYKKGAVHLNGVCAVEEAEQLLAWVLSHPGAKADLSRCEHLHSAVLQVLLASDLVVSRPPSQARLADLLAAASRNRSTITRSEN